MSAVEPIREQTEQRSSVKMSTTAKGDPVIEVKVYLGDSPAEVEAVYKLVERIFDAARARYALGNQPNTGPALR